MQIIPEFISKVTEEAQLAIMYNGRAIENAEELSPSETQDEPEVVIKGQDTYTLLMVVGSSLTPCACCHTSGSMQDQCLTGAMMVAGPRCSQPGLAQVPLLLALARDQHPGR